MFLLLFVGSGFSVCAFAQNNPHVVLETNFGEIVLELFPDQAPVTVDNFLGYVNSDFYDGLLFHRVIFGFMIQGGGFFVAGNTLYQLPPGDPIINESYNGLRNLRGTIAMARTTDPDSATSQFFINHVDNPDLDRKSSSDVGYCVFGQVVNGMDVVDAIATVGTIDLNPLDPYDPFNNFPNNPLVGMYRAYEAPCDQPNCIDLTGDGELDLADFAEFALHWLDNNCTSANDFCNGADFDYNGSCDFTDYALFVANWQPSIGQ